MLEQRLAVIAAAKSWLGTPFHPGAACVKGAGVACGPLLIAAYGAAGLPVPPVTGFPLQWHMHTTEERYRDIVTRYAHQVDTPLPGDMVLFRVFRNRPICHGGIVVEWPLVIHSSDRGCVEYLDVLKSPLCKREMQFFSYWA